MHKKLMAAAVAGALAAPVSALAATANVDIYGYFNVEYGVVHSPADVAPGVGGEGGDALNSGASRIGFRARENLGGGLQAWAQCESQVNGAFGTSTGQSGWCNRNTAVGLQGSFGNVFIGRWDSPYKRVNGETRMLPEAGWTGHANHMIQGTTPGGDEVDFSLRNAFTVNWDSPNWNGFRLMAQVTTLNATLNAAENSNTTGRRMSIGGVYSSGPLVIAAAMDSHSDNAGFTFTADGASEDGIVIGATYKLGMWEFGVTFNSLDLDNGAGGDLTKDSINLAVEYDLAGPGMIRAGYTLAKDWEGTLGTPDSGGSQWQVGYHHNFSKRTTGGLIFVASDNDDNGVYNLTNLDPAAPGEGGSVFVLQLIHRF
jgi:predicted porin